MTYARGAGATGSAATRLPIVVDGTLRALPVSPRRARASLSRTGAPPLALESGRDHMGRVREANRTNLCGM